MSVHLKEPFKQEIDKMLQAGILEACRPSYTLDKQLCTGRWSGQALQAQAKNLLGPHQSE